MEKKYSIPEIEVIGLNSSAPLCQSVDVPITDDPATEPAL